MQVIYNVSYIMFHRVQDVSSLQHVGHLVQIRQHIDAGTAIGGYSVHVVRLVALAPLVCDTAFIDTVFSDQRQ